jgi:hypothetical protein
MFAKKWNYTGRLWEYKTTLINESQINSSYTICYPALSWTDLPWTKKPTKLITEDLNQQIALHIVYTIQLYISHFVIFLY